MFYEPSKHNHGLPIDPFKAIVGPRLIGWVSTLSADGIANLAPYSFFNAVGEDPHYVAFGSDGVKDSLRNIRETGEFACNLVTYDLREQMNATSATVHSGVDEFDLAGLAKADCTLIRPPRVAASPCCLECRLFNVVGLPDDRGNERSFLVIGRVVGVHVDDKFIVDGRLQSAVMKPIARLGYSDYATVEQTWRMKRPG